MEDRLLCQGATTPPLPALRWVITTASASPPRPRHTSWREGDWRRTHSKAWAPNHVLGLLTVMDGVKDTTGVATWISPMTHFSILAWALQTVALPCLSRDIWPPSKSSPQTCHHFICNSGGLALLFEGQWLWSCHRLCPPRMSKIRTALSCQTRSLVKSTKRGGSSYWSGCSI